MNLKKRMKTIFALNRKANDGFTLVELIVVIAILAILGGVAVPAYSGYVEKAERAGDEQLLAAINTAYAAACLENGTDMALLGGASMPLADKKVDVANVEPYAESFARYYAGNEDAVFKVFSSIVFDTGKHMFVDIGDAGSFSISVNGITYKADAESVAAYLNSTLGQLGAQELLGIVGLVTDVLGEDFGDDDFAAAVQSPAYKEAAAKALGLGDADAYDAYIAAKKEAAKQQYYEDNNITPPGDRSQQKAANDAANAQIKELEKNLMPMVGASKAEDAGKDILEILKSDTAKDTIVGNVNSSDNSALGISQSALAYALYSSYAKDADMEPNPVDFLLALEGKDDGKFKAYLEKEQAKTDLAGALGAMDVISNQDSDTLEHTATNGLSNSELEKALEQILGK